MKRLISFSVVVLFLFIGSNIAFAQTSKKATGNSNGFWVIESNVKTPKQSTVLFYNNQQDLVYKETVAGKKLNIRKDKVCRQLNNVLQQSIVAWTKDQVVKENQQWIVKRK